MEVVKDLRITNYDFMINEVNHMLKFIAKQPTYIDIHLQRNGDNIGEEGIEYNKKLLKQTEETIAKASSIFNLNYKKENIVYNKHLSANETKDFDTIGYTIDEIKYEQFTEEQFVNKFVELLNWIEEETNIRIIDSFFKNIYEWGVVILASHRAISIWEAYRVLGIPVGVHDSKRMMERIKA